MLVAVSGSQGSGKSTIIAQLANQGYQTITRKTSRSILADWNVSLQEVNASPELTTRFQTEISKRKFDDESFAIDNNEIWFTERTHADLFTYSLITLGKENEYSDWLDAYYRSCMEYTLGYDLVFYLRAGHFDVESDGTRGDNRHYSRMVDLTMLDVTKQMVHNSSLSIVDTPDLWTRVNMIASQSTHLLRKK